MPVLSCGDIWAEERLQVVVVGHLWVHESLVVHRQRICVAARHVTWLTQDAQHVPAHVVPSLISCFCFTSMGPLVVW